MDESESLNADKSFRDAIAYARTVLEPRIPPENLWPTLAAAAFFAICAMTFATAAIMAPPVKLTMPATPAAIG